MSDQRLVYSLRIRGEANMHALKKAFDRAGKENKMGVPFQNIFQRWASHIIPPKCGIYFQNDDVNVDNARDIVRQARKEFGFNARKITMSVILERHPDQKGHSGEPQKIYTTAEEILKPT